MERRMIDYLPQVLRAYREIKGITDGQQWLFTQLWQETERVFANQFIDTADASGLARWEEITGLYPKGTDSLEERRFRVKTKWNQGQLPYTHRTLAQYLAAVSEDFSIEIDYGGYGLFLRIRLGSLTQRASLLTTLRKMIPANMTLTTRAEIPQESEKLTLAMATGVQAMIRHRHKATYMESASPSETLRARFAAQTRVSVQHKYKGV